jgi:hypothetical protein
MRAPGAGGGGLLEARENSAFFHALEVYAAPYDGMEMRCEAPADVDEVNRLYDDSAGRLVSFSSAEIPHEQHALLYARTIDDPDWLPLVF